MESLVSHKGPGGMSRNDSPMIVRAALDFTILNAEFLMAMRGRKLIGELMLANRRVFPRGGASSSCKLSHCIRRLKASFFDRQTSPEPMVAALVPFD